MAERYQRMNRVLHRVVELCARLMRITSAPAPTPDNWESTNVIAEQIFRTCRDVRVWVRQVQELSSQLIIALADRHHHIPEIPEREVPELEVAPEPPIALHRLQGDAALLMEEEQGQLLADRERLEDLLRQRRELIARNEQAWREVYSTELDLHQLVGQLAEARSDVRETERVLEEVQLRVGM